MALQPSLPLCALPDGTLPERRFLLLFLPYWPTDYLKRHEPNLAGPLVLYERVKGGLRLAAVDREAHRLGLTPGQNLAEARAQIPELTVREMQAGYFIEAFAGFADWHSNASPLVCVLGDAAPYGDLVLDITGVAHLFGGEAPMLRTLLARLRRLGYTVSGAIAPTIGAAWAVSHFGRSTIIDAGKLEACLDALPVAALRLERSQISALTQMGLVTIGQLRTRPRKPLQARFGATLLLRLDQAYGLVAERMTPRLPLLEQFAERRFAEPIALLDDVLACVHDLAIELANGLEAAAQGAQTFHLFLYRVDHKVMTLSLNAARLTRDPVHIAGLFRHRAQRLEAEYDAGFGIDMVRLAAGSLDRLDAQQTGAFADRNGQEDLDRLLDRLGSRLGNEAVLRTQFVASHIPERAVRLVPAVENPAGSPDLPPELPERPLRLLPRPEAVAINAEVPDGLPASMIWRRVSYRLIRAAGPERLGAEWWRSGKRPVLAPPPEPRPDKPPPYVPNLPVFDPDAGTRDYYVVEDEHGARFWVFRQGFFGGETSPVWYLHGFFP